MKSSVGKPDVVEGITADMLRELNLSLGEIDYAPRAKDEFAAQDYADANGISDRNARERLKRAAEMGVVEKRWAIENGHRVYLYREVK